MKETETSTITQINQGYSFEYAIEVENGEKGSRTTTKKRLAGYEETFQEAEEKLKAAQQTCREVT